MKNIFTLLLSLLTVYALAQPTYGEWYFDADAEGWTSSGDGVVFVWTDSGPEPTASIWGVPELNTSTPDGWMILDDDAFGQGISTDSYMTSPVLDLSEAPAQLRLEFDQYFQEFETGSDTTQIQVSSDGGDTWFTTTINDGVGRNNRPNPDHIFINITDAVAGDPSNVQIRYRYRADWSYGWQLDNIEIYELPDYDLEMYDVFLDNIITDYEYRVVPVSQAQDLEVGMIIRNFGAETLTGIEGMIEVLDPNGDPVTLDNNTGLIDSIPSFGQDTIWISTGLTPDLVGEYMFNFSATADQEDDEIAQGNESAQKSLEMTNDLYGVTADAELNYEASGREQNGIWNEFMMGNTFQIVENTDLVEVQVKLGPETTVGQEIDVWVYEWIGTDENGIFDVDEVTSFIDYHTITAEDITGEEYVTITLSDEIELVGGATYFIGVHSVGGSDELWLKCRFGDADASTVQWGDFFQDGSDFFIGWAYDTSVRIKIGEWVPNVAEIVHEDFTLGQNRPNPFTGETIIPFKLEHNAKVELNLMDISGRRIQTVFEANLPQGQHQQNINASNLEAGVYFYELVVDGQRAVKTMVVE